MGCYKAADIPAGFSKAGRPWFSAADYKRCISYCVEGVCCQGTTCAVKPECQCINEGGVYRGQGTLCSENLCGRCGCGTTGLINATSFTIRGSGAALYQSPTNTAQYAYIVMRDGGLCGSPLSDSAVIGFLNTIDNVPITLANPTFDAVTGAVTWTGQRRTHQLTFPRTPTGGTNSASQFVWITVSFTIRCNGDATLTIDYCPRSSPMCMRRYGLAEPINFSLGSNPCSNTAVSVAAFFKQGPALSSQDGCAVINQTNVSERIFSVTYTLTPSPLP